METMFGIFTWIKEKTLKIEWKKIEPEKWMFKLFQRSRMPKMPDAVYVHSIGVATLFALQYLEDGKWERWGIRYASEHNIVQSWSQIFDWLHPLIRDRAFIEVYDKDLIDSAPFRWFWVVPGDLPKEFDLNFRKQTLLNNDGGLEGWEQGVIDSI